jgi:hypothetical protein
MFHGKISYAQMTQYIHLLSNVGIGLPTDLWVPATAKVGPENAYLASMGLAYNLRNKYEFTVESYYKEMEGLVEYKDGADYLNVENDWQTKVEVGEGNSYGVEFFAQKKTGKLSGWVGYTLSWTNRTFENLNGVKHFHTDTTGDMMSKLRLSINGKKTGSFPLRGYMEAAQPSHYLNQPIYTVLKIGIHISRPKGSFQYYGDRNSYRMRAYHRLDISYTTTKKTKWGERSWSIGTIILTIAGILFLLTSVTIRWVIRNLFSTVCSPLSHPLPIVSNFKRMVMKKYAWYFLFIFLTACELIVDIEVPFKEAQLTINSFFNADSLWTASLSINQGILDTSRARRIENGLIIIYEENIPVDTLTHIVNGVYRSDNEKPMLGASLRNKSLSLRVQADIGKVLHSDAIIRDEG